MNRVLISSSGVLRRVSQLQHSVLLGLLLISGLWASRAGAFSLLGPYADWMQTTNGFQQPGDIGGPVNLGEEYRWNVPVITYAYDASFLNYFGSNGIAAVEAAIATLNALPPASQLDPSNYPPSIAAINSTAASEGLLDLKSQALAVLLEQLGLAAPSRFTFCLHNYTLTPEGAITNALVVERNFDPFTTAVSSNVNEVQFYYYFTQLGLNQGIWDAAEYRVDPLVPLPASAADGLMGDGISAGTFFTGLSRDDVGGLRYLLNTNNLNIESLLPDVHGITPNAGSYVNQAVRPGVDKITFTRVNFDSLIIITMTPFTNQFTDTYVSNAVFAQQPVERVVTRPDIVFSATDMQNPFGTQPAVIRTGTTNWLNNSMAPGASGPGTIRPPIDIVFSKPGGWIITSDESNTGQGNVAGWHWGTFDGTTNAPVIYPSGTQASSGACTVSLWLHDATYSHSNQKYQWQLPVAVGAPVLLQTSTNLVDWETLATVTNRGLPMAWEHTYSARQKFLRVIPQ